MPSPEQDYARFRDRGDVQALAVPNAPSLRHLVLWWRGLDVSVAPWQASPVFVTVVQ